MAAAAGGTATFFGPWQHNRVWAQGAKKPIKLGLTCDASGQYGNSGQDDARGIRLAIDEFNAKGGVLGRKIEWITADTETNPATGTRVAERFIAQEQCGFLIGAVHSGVANAITQVANKYGTIYLNTNSSAPSEAGENCSRVKFVWDGNGTNFSKAAVQNAVEKIGKRWLLLTNDYVWGHTTSAATKAQVEKAGGQIIDNLLVPQNTRDFASYLLKVQQAKPDVVATAVGGDDIKALRQQVSDLKLEDKAAWINNQQDWPDVWGAPRDAVRRVRHHLVSQAAAAGRRGVRQALADGLSASRRSRCRATSPTTATWRRASCCAPSSAPAPPTTSPSSSSSRATRCRRRTACSTSTPTSIPTRTRCSRRSIWRAAMPSPRTTPTCSRSSAGPSPSWRSTTPRPASAS